MDRLLDTKTVADMTGISQGTLENWRTTGRGMRYVKYGQVVRYRLSDVERWIDAHTVTPTPPPLY